MKTIEIVNNCDECGRKTSTLNVDPPKKRSEYPAIIAEIVERQKQEVIIPNHKGHTYKLKVNIRD